MKYYVCVGLICFQLAASSLQEIVYSHLLINYKRPVTVLYISENPEYIDFFSAENVVVYWSTNKTFKSILDSKQSLNCILLQADISVQNMIELADCEHFDIAIIDLDENISEVLQKVHLADNNLFLTKSDLTLDRIAQFEAKNLYLLTNPKRMLKKNWWKSCSFHKNYKIISTHDQKFLIKPKEYIDFNKSGNDKHIEWIPGLNLYTFFMMSGGYPSRKYIREKVIETFDPKICRDFGLANLVIQGQQIRPIDFDTTYFEDPYIRLKRTIELQMKMKYNWEKV